MGKLLLRSAWAMIPILSGCQTGTALDDYLPSDPPTVSGTPGAQPRNIRSVLVWGNDDRTIDAASAWVRQHGLTVVHRDRVNEALANKTATPDLLLIDEGTVLDAASSIGADAVVFADRAGDVRPPMVSVKGIDARSRRVLWSGEALYETFYGLPNTETMNVLTDQALLTAWGLQPKED